MLGLEVQGVKVGGHSAHIHVTYFSDFSRVGMKTATEPYCYLTLVHLIGEIFIQASADLSMYLSQG